MFPIGKRIAVFGGHDPTLRYRKKLIAVAPANLIGYWPMDELAGTVAIDRSTQLNNGAYTGVTLVQTGIGDGRTCPLFDGSADFNNIYSVAFAADFSGAAGTAMVWGKVLNVGIWTDSSYDELFRISAGATDEVLLRKTNTNNLYWRFTGSSTPKSVSMASGSPVTWFHMAITWSAAADQVIAYFNGSQTGATQTGLGAWSAALTSTQCCVGAYNTTPSQVWNGYLAHAALWNAVLTPAQISMLATV